MRAVKTEHWISNEETFALATETYGEKSPGLLSMKFTANQHQQSACKTWKMRVYLEKPGIFWYLIKRLETWNFLIFNKTAGKWYLGNRQTSDFAWCLGARKIADITRKYQPRPPASPYSRVGVGLDDLWSKPPSLLDRTSTRWPYPTFTPCGCKASVKKQHNKVISRNTCKNCLAHNQYP